MAYVKSKVVKAEPVYQISTKLHIIRLFLYLTKALKLEHVYNLVMPQYQVDNIIPFMKYQDCSALFPGIASFWS